MTITQFLTERIAHDYAQLGTKTPRRAWGRKVIRSSDRARWFADCEAKRRIVVLHGGEPYPNPTDEPIDMACVSRGGPLRYPVECQTLRALASVYSDHPDYREEWAL